MSRLFEALQRSEAERTGSPLPQMPSAAAELLQAAEIDELKSSAAIGSSRSIPDEIVTPTPDVTPSLEGLRTVQVSNVDPRLVSITQQDGLGAEKFRLLGVRLRNLRANRSLKRILVTSTIPEEGKSVVSANLSIAQARGGRTKTILVEGDLRRPTLANRFGLGSLPGLVDALSGQRTLNEVIYQLEPTGLCVIPAGHPPENPLELMQSGRAAAALAALSQFFEWVMVDSPPVLPLADTILWAKLTDGIILVAREGKTEKQQLMKGLELLDTSKILGMVLNASSSTDHRNYYQRYTPPSSGQDS
jgi:capsular exopolysaccharide synthesis family protein